MNAGSRRRSVREDPAASHPALFEERRAEWLKEKAAPFERRAYIVQLAIFAGLLIVWQFPVFNPFKLLVVLFHEMSHVCMAYVTGGVVFGIAIDPGGAGVTLGMGGNRLLILLAGYAGSLLIGTLLYGLSAVWRAGEVWMVLIVFSLCSLLMGWLNSFSSVFGVGTLVALVLMGMVCSERSKKLFLRMIGTACCLYPVIDVFGELWGAGLEGFQVQGRFVGSDVNEISRLTGIPWMLVSMAGLLVGLTWLAMLLRWAVHLEAGNEVKRELFRRKKNRELQKAIMYDARDPRSVPEYTIK